MGPKRDRASSTRRSSKGRKPEQLSAICFEYYDFASKSGRSGSRMRWKYESQIRFGASRNGSNCGFQGQSMTNCNPYLKRILIKS